MSVDPCYRGAYYVHFDKKKKRYVCYRSMLQGGRMLDSSLFVLKVYPPPANLKQIF